MDSSWVTSLNHTFSGGGAGQAFVRWGTTLPLVAILVLIVWVWVKEWARTTNERALLVLGIAAAACGIGICVVIGHIWPRSRPWTDPSLQVREIVGFVHGRSFSSAQLAVAGALTFVLLEVRPAFGAAAAALSILSALARVASGNNYPSDVVAGFVVGVILVLALLPLRRPASKVVDLAARFENLAVPRRPEGAPLPRSGGPGTKKN